MIYHIGGLIDPHRFLYFSEKLKRVIEVACIREPMPKRKPMSVEMGAMLDSGEYKAFNHLMALHVRGISLSASQEKLTLESHAGKPYIEFDVSGEKPVLTVYKKTPHFDVIDYETAAKAGIVYKDKTTAHAFRSVLRTLSVLAQIANPAIKRGANFCTNIIIEAISLLEEGRPYQKTNPIQKTRDE